MRAKLTSKSRRTLPKAVTDSVEASEYFDQIAWGRSGE